MWVTQSLFTNPHTHSPTPLHPQIHIHPDTLPHPTPPHPRKGEGRP